jgi:hypothetical protein
LDKVPFSVYDFFAYLSSGAVLLATADYVMGLGLMDRKDVPPLLVAVLIILAYVSGHIVAHFSSFILEQLFVGRLLKRPASILLGESPRSKILRWMFRNYFRPLPVSTQERVHAQAKLRDVAARGEGLFLHAYAVVTASPTQQARLDEFRNQYGFARNMSFAFIVAALTIGIAHRIGHQMVQLRWALPAAVAGLALLYRYLKFFRQFSYELFLRYAELPKPETTKTKTVGA